jgi:hypothetical protein
MPEWDRFQTSGSDTEPTWPSDAPEASDDGDAKPKRSRSGKKRSSSSRRGADAKLVAVAAKAIALTQAPENDLEVLAGLFGKADLAELAVAIQEGSKEASTSLEALTVVRTSDDLTAGVTIAGMDAADIKAVWKLARTLGADLDGVPSQPAHAAIALVKAVRGLDETVDARLYSIAELAAKA